MVNLGTPGQASNATAVSPNGNIIVGEIGTPGQIGQAVEWTLSGSTWTESPICARSQYNQSVAYAVNDSGIAVGGAFDYPQGGFPNVNQIAWSTSPAATWSPSVSSVRLGVAGTPTASTTAA